MKIKIKQLFDEITKQKVYPLTTLKAVRDPKSKKALDEMLLVGEDEESAEEVAHRDADLLGGKYKATDIDKSVIFEEDEELGEVEDVVIVDSDRLGGKYTATDVDALKQRIVELETENEKLNNSLSDVNSNLSELTNDMHFTARTDRYGEIDLPVIGSGKKIIYAYDNANSFVIPRFIIDRNCWGVKVIDFEGQPFANKEVTIYYAVGESKS